MDEVISATKNFLSAATMPCSQIDVTLGRSGVLIGCTILYKELVSIKNYSTVEIVLLAENIKNEIWQQLDQYPSMQQANPVDYFGIAHGWAGLLYATLFWCKTASCNLPTQFMTRVEELFNCAVQKESGISWPITVADKKVWPGWCNGNSGHIFLWTLLYQYFKEEKYIQAAQKLADELLTCTQKTMVDLCCGTGGMAYAMINLYKATNEKKYFTAVQSMQQDILKNWFIQPLKNNSLYKSEVGIGVLLGEITNIAFARMPLFE